jgi:hypothetical protein
MTVHDIGSVLLVTCAVMAIVFCTGYHLSTNGGWNDTEEGRHLMYFTASIAAILTMYTVKIISGSDAVWFEIIRLIIFVSFPIVLGWRLAMLWRYQFRFWLRARRRDKDGRPDDRTGPGRVPTEEQR